MGNWYTNICIKGSTQAEVVAALNDLGRRAYLTPEVNGWLIVYDQESDKFELNELESLAKTLSMRLSSTALASFNADDDVLWLGTYESGNLTTRYASEKKHFEDGPEFPPTRETAEVLCRILQKPERQRQVKKILLRPHSVLGLLAVMFRIPFAYLAEVLRHHDLAQALGLPEGSVGLGYKYVDSGETPEGLNRVSLRRTLNA